MLNLEICLFDYCSIMLKSDIISGTQQWNVSLVRPPHSHNCTTHWHNGAGLRNNRRRKMYTFWFLTKPKYEHQTHCFQSMRIGLDLDGELNHIHKLFQLEIRTLDTSLASWYLAVPTYTSYELLTTLSFIVKSAVGGATMWYKCQPQSKISPSHFFFTFGD